MMLEELQRRHYSEATTQRYIRFIERFAQHFHCSPGRLGPQHIREYQAQLFTVHKLTPGSVTNHLCALRSFYIQTLQRPWSIADTPYPKKRYRLPTILSQEEVAQLIDAAPTPFYRNILMTLYSTGVRRAELTRLKVSDIDSNSNSSRVSACTVPLRLAVQQLSSFRFLSMVFATLFRLTCPPNLTCCALPHRLG